jgi:hypothetical protein
MTRSNNSECFILLFYCGSIFRSSIGVQGYFVISMDDSLIIKECGLDPRRRIREADSIRTAG